MRIARVFYDGSLNIGDEIILPSETSHYLIHVLRLRKNTAVKIFNGQGGQYEGILCAEKSKKVTVKILKYEFQNNESPLKIHLGQGISRGDRMDYAVQKAVELGVTTITPLITEYCSLKLERSRFEKKMRHWQGIVISACEQSGRTLLPVLKPIEKLSQWIANRDDEDIKIICHPEQQQQLQQLQITDVNKIALLIGPEGGFSDEEVKQSVQANFACLNLGPRILRTETAATAAITVLQYVWGDMQLTM